MSNSTDNILHLLPNWHRLSTIWGYILGLKDENALRYDISNKSTCPDEHIQLEFSKVLAKNFVTISWYGAFSCQMCVNANLEEDPSLKCWLKNDQTDRRGNADRGVIFSWFGKITGSPTYLVFKVGSSAPKLPAVVDKWGMGLVEGTSISYFHRECWDSTFQVCQ